MRKELTVYVTTNEQDEEIKVMRVKDDPKFFLLTLGTNRMVVNIGELMEAVGAIGHYSALFDQEEAMRLARDSAPVPNRVVLTPASNPNAPAVIPKRRLSKVANEDEGAMILDAQIRTGPTASELALEKQTSHMTGDSLVLKET